MEHLNTTKLIDFQSNAIIKAHPDAIWIANTKNETMALNDEQFKLLTSQGKGTVRFIAYHQNANNANDMPNEDISKKLFALNSQRNSKTCDVPTYLDLCLDLRVMLTNNLGTEIGLTNGTLGKVVGFGIDTSQQNISVCIPPKHFYNANVSSAVVFVQFPTLRVPVTDTIINGKAYANVIPVPYVGNFKQPLKVDNQKYYRWQLPLVLAAAINTHKVQGISAANGIVMKPTPSDKFPYARGLEYVALSRCTNISNDNLILLQPLTIKHFKGSIKTQHENEMITTLYDNFRNFTTVF